MEKKFSPAEILEAVQDILQLKKNKIKNQSINLPKKNNLNLPLDTENIIKQAESFLKK